MPSEDVNIIKILLPPSKIVVLNGKEYKVQKLGYAHGIRLLRFFATLREEVREKIIENTENVGDFWGIVQSLADEQVPEFLSILLGVNGVDKVHLCTLTFEDISELALALTEINDFEKIIKNFQKAAGNIKGIEKLMKPLLSPPSEQ